MQEDMHYYGTYAVARAAGLTTEDARVIAYSAQYVDDSTHNESHEHEDGGMLRSIATAHHTAQVAHNAKCDHVEQRKVWVPFHFFPGNQGSSPSERLICRKNSQLARARVTNHIPYAWSVNYGLQLIGIMAHVYLDTFSHYGFSGVSSRQNAVDGGSFDLQVENDEMRSYIEGKFGNFLKKHAPDFVTENWRKAMSAAIELGSGTLGHGSVGTYPDRPFLHWSFKYEKSNKISERNNPETYMEGCEFLHQRFMEFAAKRYGDGKHTPVPFEDIREKVKKVIQLEARKEDRINAWREAIKSGSLFKPSENEALEYSPDEWENQKKGFHSLEKSEQAIQTEVYRFHQAAIYHRDFTLKHLLPENGIVVF